MTPPGAAERGARASGAFVGATAYPMDVAALAIDALLDGLNPQQRAAVVHEGSPLLIVAGAGSGKTRVLTHRIAYLLAARDVAPHEILAITFTNKAAGEMAARVAALVGPRARSMWVMTFHSACVRILRREAKRFGYPSSFSIYDQADSQRLMALTCRELELDAKQFPPKTMAAQVSNLKNELIDYETFASQAQTARDKALAEAYGEYQRRLFAAGAMDFDDLIMVTVNLFQALPEVAQEYRRRFRHVLVDEYQDTNHAQYILVRELVSGGAPALFLPNGRVERYRRTLSRPPSCAWSATRTSPSTPSAAPPSATSWSSSRTTRTPRSSCWSRTTGPPRTSWPPPTPWSRRTRAASRRTCGPTRARARRSPATWPTTSTTRPRSWPRRWTG